MRNVHTKKWQEIAAKKYKSVNYKCECEGDCKNEPTRLYDKRPKSRSHTSPELHQLMAVCLACYNSILDRRSVLDFPPCCKSIHR